MNKSDLLSHLRTFITICLSIVGGFLIFRKKRLGWILGNTVLILLLIICSGGLYQAIKLNDTSLMLIAGLAWSVLFGALLVLLVPRTRKKFAVNATTLIFTFAFATLLGLFYFYLQ